MGKQKNKRRELDNEAKVVLRNVRVSPQKLNLVAQMIRKQAASKLFLYLSFLKEGFQMMLKRPLGPQLQMQKITIH